MEFSNGKWPNHSSHGQYNPGSSPHLIQMWVGFEWQAMFTGYTTLPYLHVGKKSCSHQKGLTSAAMLNVDSQFMCSVFQVKPEFPHLDSIKHSVPLRAVWKRKYALCSFHFHFTMVMGKSCAWWNIPFHSVLVGSGNLCVTIIVCLKSLLRITSRPPWQENLWSNRKLSFEYHILIILSGLAGMCLTASLFCLRKTEVGGMKAEAL